MVENLSSKIETLADMLNLTAYLNTQAQYLSGGNKRKLQIAMALISSPSLVLFDEGTTGLDPVSRRNLYAYLRSNKITALIITQSLDDIESYCDKVGILVKGNLQEFANPADLLRKYFSSYTLQLFLPI